MSQTNETSTLRRWFRYRSGVCRSAGAEMYGHSLLATCVLLVSGGLLDPAYAIVQQARTVGPTGRVTLVVSPEISAGGRSVALSSSAYSSNPISVFDPTARAEREVLSPVFRFGRDFQGQVGIATNPLAFSVAAADGPAPPASPGSSAPAHPIFAPSSFWYTPIPTDTSLHPNSANFVRDFMRQLKKYYGRVGINTAAYSSPIYVVGTEVATTSVEPWDCHRTGYRNEKLAQQWLAVPIPSYAQPADGTDAEMTIYQPATDTIWEFWKARKVEGRWEACWGGRMQDASTNNGIWPSHFGTTATGLPFLGGQITVDELRRGVIPHAIGIALVHTEHWNVVSWPANRSDGWNPDNLPDQIPEGLRFRLDPTINVAALNIHPIAKIIAKAAQDYGFVVWDRAGAIGLRAENPKRFTVLGMPDPYPALWNGTPSYNILAGFPWDRLQFLPMNYGKP